MPSPRNTTDPTYRVLLFTDAEAIRVPVMQVITELPNLELAAATTGRIEAVSRARGRRANLILLDIGASGALALAERVRDVMNDVPVVLIGKLNFSNVKSSMDALQAGAIDFIPTPTEHAADTDIPTFTRHLLRILASLEEHPSTPTGRADPPVSEPVPFRAATPGMGTPQVLLIGSSTGGPKAVIDMLSQLGPSFHLPIVIAQHMPPSFTAAFAASLQNRTGLITREGEDGEIVRPGRAYVAPGDRHLLLIRDGGHFRIKLDDGPPVNFCRPAVDPLFTSAAAAYGGEVLAVVLTGMGHDGREGARQIVSAGGTVLVQDKETSVVWGMPGAVAEAGLAAEILPLDQIAGRIRALA